mgnify:CR=1 FL=1
MVTLRPHLIVWAAKVPFVTLNTELFVIKNSKKTAEQTNFI